MEDRQEKYITILKHAKASENEAIRLYMLAMAYAPPEDIPKLAEILNDENDHDVIDTDLLFKAVTGADAGQEGLYVTDGDYIQGPDGKLNGSKPGGGAAPEGSGSGAKATEFLGPEYSGVKGQAAVEKLLKERQGHVKGAFHRDDTGDIILAWGDDNMGIQHIINHRNLYG
jgi:hypothetical protein